MSKKLFTITMMMAAIALAVQVNSCKKSKDKATLTIIPFTIPDGFPEPVYDFKNNPLTKESVELGRKLFYDGRLSKDGNFPCASCHQQFAAFATFDHDLSHGFNNQFTTRNAPGLFNLAWYKELHWDGGINHIEVQPLAPITAPNEMAEDINTVITKLKSDDLYKSMFYSAYGSDEITSQKMLKALSQFMLLLSSSDSKYDKVKKGQAVFNSLELAGYNAFQLKCANCHKEPLFTDLSYRNNGLTLNAALNDKGRMRITNKKEDSLKFRVPSLRNVAITFPYMHDGRLYTLDQVFYHYENDVQTSATLDPLLKNKIQLSSTEKINLKAFLRTLTDSTFIKDKRFEQPPQ
jgi:cytochrome c peroxidase